MSDLEKLRDVRFSEVADPMSEAFALTEKEASVPRIGPWTIYGHWRYRELGREIHLRNKKLPHLTLDLFRTEAEDLFGALGSVLGRPAPIPYKVGAWDRFRMWWSRAVWNRKHSKELAEYRSALIKEYSEKSPWG